MLCSFGPQKERRRVPRVRRGATKTERIREAAPTRAPVWGKIPIRNRHRKANPLNGRAGTKLLRQKQVFVPQLSKEIPQMNPKRSSQALNATSRHRFGQPKKSPASPNHAAKRPREDSFDRGYRLFMESWNRMLAL
jgi:hypothetical protein